MNSILGYYLMPHPPIIVPGVGKGEEKKIQATSDACRAIAKEIKELAPETIIIVTPHGPMFSDAIAITQGEEISGDLSRFGFGELNIKRSIDKEFNQRLAQYCQERELPAALVEEPLLSYYKLPFALDHGALVPLQFIEREVKDYHLVHITYAMLSELDLYRFGMGLQKVAQELGRKAVLIASGDLSHRLKDSGPYDYSPHGEEYDRQVLQHLQEGNIEGVFSLDSCMVEEAGECGLRSIQILLGAMEGQKVKGEILSYEGPFGVGYGVMKFAPLGEQQSILSHLQEKKEKKRAEKIAQTNPYVRLARETLNDYYGVDATAKVAIPEDLLEKKHGVFVSLKKYGQLRGCIGTFLPTTNSVAEEIIQNAVGAATRDLRFSPVRKDELDELELSVDILMEPETATKEQLDPKRYGVIVTQGGRRGLLLPDLEGIDEVGIQLEIACDKGDIDQSQPYEIQRFEVIRHREGEA